MPKGCTSCQHSAAVRIRLTRPGGGAGSVPAHRGCRRAQPCLHGSEEVLLPACLLRHRRVPRARFLLLLMGETPAELSPALPVPLLQRCLEPRSLMPASGACLALWFRAGPRGDERLCPQGSVPLAGQMSPGWALHGCSLASAAGGVLSPVQRLEKKVLSLAVLFLQLIDGICFLGSASPSDSGF